MVEPGCADAAIDAGGHAVVVHIVGEGEVFVAGLLFQAVGAAERHEEAAEIEAALQFDALGNFAVVLDEVFVGGGVDDVFDGVGEISEAHVAFAQPAPQRGEVVAVADFPVGAAFGLEVEGGQHGFQIHCAEAHIGGFVDAGEARHLRPAQVQAAVVGEVVAEGEHGRPGRAVEALYRRIVGVARYRGMDVAGFVGQVGAGQVVAAGAIVGRIIVGGVFLILAGFVTVIKRIVVVIGMIFEAGAAAHAQVAVVAALPALRVAYALVEQAVFKGGAVEFAVAVFYDFGSHRAVEYGAAFIESLVLAVAVHIAGVAVLVVARQALVGEETVALFEVAVDGFEVARVGVDFGSGAAVGIDFFLRHQLQIRQGNAADDVAAVGILGNGIGGVAAGAGAGEQVVKRPEAVVADAAFDFQAFGRPPVETQLRAPFFAPSGTRAGELGERGYGIHHAEEVLVVFRHFAAFVQLFVLVAGGEGEAELVVQAHAVADVEAGAGGFGGLHRAGEYGVCAVDNGWVVGRGVAVVAFVYQLLAAGDAACRVGLEVVAEAARPGIVFFVAEKHGQIGAAALVAGAGGVHAPDVGFEVDPAAAFGLPLVADFVGAASDIGV